MILIVRLLQIKLRRKLEKMNSKGHLFISLGKSGIRVIGGIVALLKKSVVPLAIGVIVAEVGGVLEELVDER